MQLAVSLLLNSSSSEVIFPEGHLPSFRISKVVLSSTSIPGIIDYLGLIWELQPLMVAEAAYIMDKMRIRQKSAQLQAETGTEFGNDQQLSFYSV